MKLQVLLIAAVLVCNLVNGQTVAQIFDEAETWVKNAATRMALLYGQQCDNNPSTCQNQLYDQCDSKLPSALDVFRSGITLSQCGSEAGISQDYTQAGARCSNSGTCDDADGKKLACAMGKLFDDSVDANTLRFDENSKFLMGYTGHENTYQVAYPYYPAKKTCTGACEEYDPTERGWYTKAYGGADNIFLLLDFSSAATDSQITAQKAAAISLLDSLDSNDFFCIIFIAGDSSEIKVLSDATTLTQATSANIAAAKTAVNGQAKIELAGQLKVALEKVKTIKGNSSSVNTKNMIVHVSVEEEGVSLVASDIDTNVFGGESNYYYFAVPLQSTTTKAQALQCGSNLYGMVITEADESNLSEKIVEFSEYIDDNSQNAVFWSEEYDDATTGEKMITVSKIVFYEDANSLKQYIGVVGLDILLADVSTLSGYQAEYQARLTNTIGQQNENISSCQLEQYREEYFSNQCGGISGCGSFEDFTCSISDSWEKSESDDTTDQYRSVCPTSNAFKESCASPPPNDNSSQNNNFIVLVLVIVLGLIL